MLTRRETKVIVWSASWLSRPTRKAIRKPLQFWRASSCRCNCSGRTKTIPTTSRTTSFLACYKMENSQICRRKTRGGHFKNLLVLPVCRPRRSNHNLWSPVPYALLKKNKSLTKRRCSHWWTSLTSQSEQMKSWIRHRHSFRMESRGSYRSVRNASSLKSSKSWCDPVSMLLDSTGTG